MANPENPCSERGCPAACCRNISLELSKKEASLFIEDQSVKYLNPSSLEVSNLDEIAYLKPGVYIVEDPETHSNDVTIYIRGICPYIEKSTYNCSIYGKKKRPGICSEVPIGHSTCSSQRMRLGLKPV